MTAAAGTLVGCQSSVAGYGGVCDLSGNVWEWEDSCDAGGASADCRLRGGSFGSNGAFFLKCNAGHLRRIHREKRRTRAGESWVCPGFADTLLFLSVSGSLFLPVIPLSDRHSSSSVAIRTTPPARARATSSDFVAARDDRNHFKRPPRFPARGFQRLSPATETRPVSLARCCPRWPGGRQSP
jgi:hypothetical protein